MKANKMNMRTMRECARARSDRSFYMVCYIDFSVNLFPTKNRAFFCVISFLCSMHHKTHTCILISLLLFFASANAAAEFVCLHGFLQWCAWFFPFGSLATIFQEHTVHCMPFHLNSDDDRIQAHFSASSLNIMNKYTLCFVFIRCRCCFFFVVCKPTEFQHFNVSSLIVFAYQFFASCLVRRSHPFLISFSKFSLPARYFLRRPSQYLLYLI